MRTLLLSSMIVLGAVPATAATIEFNGSYTQQNPPAAATGRCAPAARTVTFGPTIAPASGISTLGAFAPSGSHCINPPLPTSYAEGLFTFDFGMGDLITGSYAGILSATADPQAFANLQDYLVTGGTGRFAGATGSLQGIGTVTFQPGVLPTSFQTVTGLISVTAIPEPGSWITMIAGFAMLGASLRRRSPYRLTRGTPRKSRLPSFTPCARRIA